VSKDTRSEALDNIHDIIVHLLARSDLPPSVQTDLRIAEALARHRDLSDFLDPRDAERLAEIRAAIHRGDTD
jgi:hypothetical protein